MIKIKTKQLQSLLSKLNVAVEKTAFKPSSGWVHINIDTNGKILLQVSNFDYYVEASFEAESESNEALIATVEAETFIPLVSKLTKEYLNVRIDDNGKALILSTDSNLYTFPLQINQSTGEVAEVPAINFDAIHYSIDEIPGKCIASITNINAKGFSDDSKLKKAYQSFVYVDNVGAVTFTGPIYINDFHYESVDEEEGFKILLNEGQSKLLSIFGDEEKVFVEVERTSDDNAKRKARFLGANMRITYIVQPNSLTNEFPAEKIRNIVSSDTHVVVDREEFIKALARLMVFDKKFNSTVMDYSKIEWKEKECKLVSVKSKNFEVIPYINAENAFEHESIIRFADLIGILKVFTSKEIDMSYGSSPAITINAEEFKQLVPEVVKR